jgi:hypothetical protein
MEVDILPNPKPDDAGCWVAAVVGMAISLRISI